LSYTAVNRYADSVGDGISDWWRARYFGGSGTTTNSQSCATCDPDQDGVDNRHEYLADTDPTSPSSWFRLQADHSPPGVVISFASSTARSYTLFSRTNLASGSWSSVAGQGNLSGTGGVMMLTNPPAGDAQRFFRVGVQLPSPGRARTRG
jgi:hypothetical protein